MMNRGGQMGQPPMMQQHQQPPMQQPQHMQRPPQFDQHQQMMMQQQNQPPGFQPMFQPDGGFNPMGPGQADQQVLPQMLQQPDMMQMGGGSGPHMHPQHMQMQNMQMGHGPGQDLGFPDLVADPILQFADNC